MSNYTFYKNKTGWFVDLPGYLQKGGKESELEMVEGADIMLDMYSGRSHTACLDISDAVIEDADVLILTEKADPLKGGGYYQMPTLDGKNVNLHIWLCGVLEFVFGKIPSTIFIKNQTPE